MLSLRAAVVANLVILCILFYTSFISALTTVVAKLVVTLGISFLTSYIS